MTAPGRSTASGTVRGTVRAPTLLVIAKEPLPGRVKTRLARDVGEDAAARVARACLADTLEVVLDAPARRRVLVLDGRPGTWVPRGIDVVQQGGGGLAERLAAAFAQVEGPAFLVGMDTPQLVGEDLRPDLSAGAALGCAADGGFWGIGMLDPDPRVFAGVPISTPSTGAVQRRRLREHGMQVVDLAVKTDVDTLADARIVAALAPGTRFAAVWRSLDHAPVAVP